MRRGARITLIVVFSVFGVIIIGMLSGAMSLGIPKQDYRVGAVDFRGLPDGTYTGEYRIVPPFGAFAVYKRVKVRVEAAGGRVQRITILFPEPLKAGLTALVDRVIQRQSLNVDSVTGGTWSSRALL